MDEYEDYAEAHTPFARDGLHPAWLLVVIPVLCGLLAGVFLGGSVSRWPF